MTLGDIAAQNAEADRKVFPLIAGGKRPAIKNWEEEATTDLTQIAQWWTANPSYNVGIATGPSELVVVDLDGPEAIAWWEQNGIPGGAEVHTPSGGKHFYWWVGPEVEIQTNRSKIFRGIDIRASGGLTVAPGSVTPKGMYRGDLSNIPEAPEELLDMLPRRQHFDRDVDLAELANVTPVEVASEQEGRELEWIAGELDGLERPWKEGAGWRSVVFQMSCYLWRMVRAPWYAINEDQALTLLLEHAPSDQSWGDQHIVAEWQDAGKRTAGQVASQPEETRPPLLPWNGFPTDRAFPSVNGQDFAPLWMTLPDNATLAGRWGRRQQLLQAMLGSGFTEQEAATIVWHSAAASHPGFSLGGVVYHDPDSRVISDGDLWREVDKAAEQLAKNSGATVEAAPLDERPTLEIVPKELPFLTEKEQAFVDGPEGEWWGSRFVDWARATYGRVNEGYYRLNRWAILSVILGNKAMLPAPGGNPRRLTLYMMLVGPTTSGKSTAFGAVRNLLKAYYLAADSPDIGGDHTQESLKKTLLARDGLSSLFRMDEAHEIIATRWNREMGPFAGMKGALLDLFDGEVTSINRATDMENSGKSADAFLTVHLMGTHEGMVNVLGPKDWTSGLIPRFVWGVGERIERERGAGRQRWISEEQLANLDEGERKAAGRKVFQQWAAEFQAMSMAVSGPTPYLLNMPQAVVDRWADFDEELYALAQRNPMHRDQLVATFDRLAESVMRAAGLVALSRKRRRVEMGDLLIAIDQGAEWVQNVLVMVRETEESIRDRQVNAIERALLEAGGTLTVATLHRKFPNRRREIEDLVLELVAQGRAEKPAAAQTGGIETVRLKGVTNERSAA